MAKPVHKQGKSCGYTLNPDGSIEMAPVYATAFKEIIAEQEAVKKLLEDSLTHLKSLEASIQKRRAALWDAISDDYGLDKKTPYFVIDGETLMPPKKEDQS
jgi:hypothetical protein